MTSDSRGETLSACIQKIDGLVASLTELVSQCDPSQLLRTVFWQAMVHAAGPDPGQMLTIEQGEWLWTLTYVQNLIAAVPPRQTGDAFNPDEAALRVRRLVGDLFTNVAQNYLFGWKEQEHQRRSLDEAAVFLEFLARYDWLHIRRSRFPRHDRSFLRRVLGPHDEVLTRCWGINTERLADALDRQVYYHQFALSLAMAKLLMIEAPNDDILMLSLDSQRLIFTEFLARRADPTLPRTLCAAVGDRYYDFGTISGLPESLLDTLSWEPGAEMTFLAPGQFRGWPLRTTPIHQRPLLKIGGRYFCTNSEALSTLLYRSMYWAARAREPKYIRVWKERQKKACEEFAATSFAGMLPGAEVIRNYYIDDPDPRHTDKLERDVLVKFDDLLIFIECKSGQFAWLPPATSFKAYRNSLEELVLEPLKQTRVNRTLLERGELIVYRKEDEKRNTFTEIGRFKKGAYRAVIYCGVMLEAFPGPAACEASLQLLLDQDEGPEFWCVAIEDLLACEDLFDSPTTFSHFLQHRTRPGRQLTLAMEELDHVHNYFAQLTRGESRPSNRLGTIPYHIGGTEAIARLYWKQDREARGKATGASDSPRMTNQSAQIEQGDISPLSKSAGSGRYRGALFEEMRQFLDTCSLDGRTRVAAALYGMPASDRANLIRELDKSSLKATYGQIARLASITASLLITTAPEDVGVLDFEARTVGLQFLYSTRASELIMITLSLHRTGRLKAMRWQILQRGELI